MYLIKYTNISRHIFLGENSGEFLVPHWSRNSIIARVNATFQGENIVEKTDFVRLMTMEP